MLNTNKIKRILKAQQGLEVPSLNNSTLYRQYLNIIQNSQRLNSFLQQEAKEKYYQQQQNNQKNLQQWSLQMYGSIDPLNSSQDLALFGYIPNPSVSRIKAHTELQNPNNPPAIEKIPVDQHIKAIQSKLNYEKQQDEEAKQKAIDEIYATFYRQTLFAHYELEVSRLIEKNQPINHEVLSNIMIRLYKQYYGLDITKEKLQNIARFKQYLSKDAIRIVCRHCVNQNLPQSRYTFIDECKKRLDEDPTYSEIISHFAPSEIDLMNMLNDDRSNSGFIFGQTLDLCIFKITEIKKKIRYYKRIYNKGCTQR